MFGLGVPCISLTSKFAYTQYTQKIIRQGLDNTCVTYVAQCLGIIVYMCHIHIESCIDFMRLHTPFRDINGIKVEGGRKIMQ